LRYVGDLTESIKEFAGTLYNESTASHIIVAVEESLLAVADVDNLQVRAQQGQILGAVQQQVELQRQASVASGIVPTQDQLYARIQELAIPQIVNPPSPNPVDVLQQENTAVSKLLDASIALYEAALKTNGDAQQNIPGLAAEQQSQQQAAAERAASGASAAPAAPGGFGAAPGGFGAAPGGFGAAPAAAPNDAMAEDDEDTFGGRRKKNKQRGGGAAAQIFDVAVIFRDMCGMAANFVNAKISENIGTYPDLSENIGKVWEVLAQSPSTTAVASDVQEFWESSLSVIRDRAEVNYGAAYIINNTDVTISLLLSTGLKDGTIDFDPYISDTPVRRDIRELEEISYSLLTLPPGVPLASQTIAARTLIILTLFDNMLSTGDESYLTKSTAYVKTGPFAIEEQGSFVRIPEALRNYLIILQGPIPQQPNVRQLRSRGGRGKTRKGRSKRLKTYRKKKLF
jgi:hypothetical protein